MIIAESKNFVTAKCHCGNIKVKFTPEKPLDKLCVRHCDCDFCRAHSTRWTSDPEGRLEISIADEHQVNHYQFGHGTAEFLICTLCGVVPAVLSYINGNIHACFNINTATDPSVFPDNASIVNFDNESTEDRLNRRRINWISTVIIKTA